MIININSPILTEIQNTLDLTKQKINDYDEYIQSMQIVDIFNVKDPLSMTDSLKDLESFDI